MKLSDAQINDISQSLDCGFVSYIHKESQEVLTIPEENRFISALEAWQEDIRKVEKDPGKYIMIEPPGSNQSFRQIAEFAESVEDNGVRSNLVQAFNAGSLLPISNFRSITPGHSGKNGSISKISG